jgi:hypothetical protein
MTTSSRVEEKIRGFTGQKSGLPFGLLNPSDASRIDNFIIRKGKLRKAWGTEEYAAPVLAGSGGVKWIDRYGNKWIYQQGTMVAIESAEESAVFAQLSTGFQDARIRSAKWRDLIFMLNGYDNKYYDGTSVKNIGLKPPGNGVAAGSQPAITLVEVGSGGTLADATTYSYLVTWYDSATGVESLPNGAAMGEKGLWSGNKPASELTNAGTNSITVNIAALKAAGYDSRVTNFFVYRKVLADDTYKRITANPENGFAIALNSATDTNGTETDLGALLDEDNSPPPYAENYIGTDANTKSARFVKFFQEQLWLFGASFPGNAVLGYKPINGIIYASATQNPDYYLYDYETEVSNQEEDNGIAEHANTLFFLRTKSIYYVDGTNPLDYVVRKLRSKRGCVASGSLQETANGIIALSADGFIMIDSVSTPKLISDDIYDVIRNINFEARDAIISGYDLQEGKYECHVPLGVSTKANAVLVYDVEEKTWTVLGKRTGGAIHYDLNSDNERVGLLGDQNIGKLLNVVDETTFNFNGEKIFSRWASKQFDFGYPGLQKRLVFLKIKAKAIEDFKISIDIIQDFGQQETISFEDIESESEFSTWAEDENDADGMEWNRDQWSGAFVDRKIEVLLSGIAKNFQVVIRENQNSAAKSGFEIEEITLEGNLLGR